MKGLLFLLRSHSTVNKKFLNSPGWKTSYLSFVTTVDTNSGSALAKKGTAATNDRQLKLITSCKQGVESFILKAIIKQSGLLYLFQFLREFPEDFVLVEELALITMLEVFGDALAHLTWQLTVSHVLLHLFNFLAVLATGGVQALDEVGGVTQKHGITSGTADHGQHGQPHVCQALRRKTPITNAEHV